MKELLRLAEEAWKCHTAFHGSPILVRPSLPILYFGDLEAYERSPRRILTVALNPSKIEFPSQDSMSRFPSASHLVQASSSLDDDALNVYIGALNAYFQIRPYKTWFDGAYSWLLAGMDASFYGNRASTALHTDLCSPLATDPTWSHLHRTQCTGLIAGGLPLWHQLVEYLQPDIVLLSVKKALLRHFRFGGASEWETLYTVERDNPYLVLGKRAFLKSGKSVLLVFGQAAQLPFGTVSNVVRREVGEFLSTQACLRVVPQADECVSGR